MPLPGLRTRFSVWREVLATRVGRLVTAVYGLVTLLDTIQTHLHLFKSDWLLAVMPGWTLERWALVGISLLLALTLEGAFREISNRDKQIADFNEMPLIVIGHTSAVQWIHHREQRYSEAKLVIDFFNKGKHPASGLRMRLLWAPYDRPSNFTGVVDHTPVGSLPPDAKFQIDATLYIQHTHDPKVPIMVAVTLEHRGGFVEAHWLRIIPDQPTTHSPSADQLKPFVQGLEAATGLALQPV